ncbi:MAG: flagellar M-ring protein FliF [Kiritimatiellae bacterium]|nr:flagellar M-ring protein FliF [Kiritimatiellia bacterium]
MTPQVVRVLLLQVREIWKRIGVNQKISLALALAACIAVVAGLLYWGTRPEYRLLYAGLALKDAAAIREKLEEERVSVQLKDSGRSLYVPASDVYRARLLLASEGLPKDTAAGFELFEQPKFGLTDFAQKVNYQRALQGELERTIASMRNIEAARITLVLPKEKLFASREEKTASASIMLTVTGGSTIPARQVNSIKHMVASAVPGLAASSVTVVDQEGRLLSAPSEPTEDDTLPADDQLAAQHKIEAELAGKAQEMLDRALGPERSIVRVSAEVDFSRVEKRLENYDSEGRVPRIERITTEKTSRPASSLEGAATVTRNVPVLQPNAATTEQAMSTSKKENIQTEYLVPGDVQRVLETGARIKRLSVSVCVARDAEARNAAALKEIEDLVASAVGCVNNAPLGRSDTITVKEMDFPEAPGLRAAPWWAELPISLESLGRGILVALLLLVVFVIARRMIAGAGVQGTDVGIPIQALGAGARAAGAIDAGAAPDGTRLQEHKDLDLNIVEVMENLKEDPKAAAAWIKHTLGNI